MKDLMLSICSDEVDLSMVIAVIQFYIKGQKLRK